MGYQVLARKWRPKQFTEMVGQGHVLKALVNALDDDRLHHAYLFTGTRGVGKTSIARLFAKALNCEQGISSKPCGECGACQEIAEGRFVDLIEVDAASRTKVEDTRELLENVQYAPSRGRFKVYLIDEVHMLSKSSFNALLKTLEEPPPHVKFLLATTDPQKLPVTVLSRCLQFNLKNMIPQRIVEHLAKVLSCEEISFEEEALWLLARSADGSMRDALSLTDQSIAFGAGSINEADVRVMLGSIDLRLVYDILSSLIQGDGVRLLKCVADLAQFSPDYNTVLGDIVSLLHRIAIAQTVPAALDNSLGDKQQVTELAAQLNAEDVQLFYQIALMGRKDLPFVPDAREGLEMTLLRMLTFRPASSSNLSPKPLVNNEVLNAGSANASTEILNNTPKTSEQAVEKATEVASMIDANNADHLADKLPESITSQKKTELSSNESLVKQAIEQNELVVVTHVSDRKIDSSNQSQIVENAPVESYENYNSAQVESAGSENSQVFNELSVPPVNLQHQKVDRPPWEEEHQQDKKPQPSTEFQQNKEFQIKQKSQPNIADSQVTKITTEKEANVSSRSIESSASQININHMLDPAVTSLADLGLDDWPALVGSIGFTGMTAHIAENLSLEQIESNRIEFNVSKVQKNVLDNTQKGRIQTSLSEYFNCDVQVGFESQKSTRETPWQCFEKLRAKRLSQAIASFQGNDIVQKITQAFAGEVDRSSIMPMD